MTFFSRPNLDNTQFKQLSGSTLTLDGQTIINTVSGLSLTGDGGKIPIVVTGETDGYVLTYFASKNQIELAISSASGGSTVYNGASPTTCTVGGLTCNTSIAGCGIGKILEMILVPTLSPTCVAPYNTLSLTPSTTVFEAGCQMAFVASATFNRGSVSPVYCGGPSTRTGLPVSYNYVDTFGVVCASASTNLTNSVTLAPRYIKIGNNSVIGTVTYSSGEYPIKSDGSISGMTCCPAGTTSPAQQINLIGVYPYFFGSSATPPIINQALISGGSKCVALSTRDIIVTNYNVIGQYIWFAIPCASASKIKWQGANSPSNCGTIPGDLFHAETTCTISSPSSCWVDQCYKFYVSNYPTSINYAMTFKNS